MAKETLTVEIRAQADKAIQEMRRFNDAAKKSADRIGRLTKLAKAYWAEALVVMAALKKVIGFVKTLTAAYIADERAEALLNSTLKATGIWTENLSKQLTRYGVEMQKVTKYSKAQVWEAQGIVATFTQIGTDIYPRVIESAMNMSEVFGQDLKQSIIQLSKAINDPRMVENLSRIGVTMSDQQIKMIDYNVEIGNVAEAQRIILEELELEMGNVARTLGKTFGHQVEIMKNLVIEWKGAIGELIGEGMKPLIESMNVFMSNAKNLEVVVKIVRSLGAAYAQTYGFYLANYKLVVEALQIMIAYWKAYATVVRTALDPRQWGKGNIKRALAELKETNIKNFKDIYAAYEKWIKKSVGRWKDIYGPDLSNQIDTVGWIAQNSIKGVGEAAEETGEKLKDLNELVTVWSDQVAQLGLDASFYINQQRDMRTGADEITEAMKEGNEVIMTYSENIGLLSEQIHDLTDLKGDLAKQEKENMDILNEQMSIYFPIWSQMFADLGDSTISAAEAMGKALKNMVADYLMSLSKQAFAEALHMLAKLRPGRAALFFVASAAAAAGAGFVRSLAEGGQFVTTGPEIIQVGERGSERVTVEPIADINNSVTMPLTIQFGHQTIRREIQYQLDSGGVAVPQRVIV